MSNRIVLFGAGKIAEKIIEKRKYDIEAIIDNNIQKIGTMLMELPIISLEQYLSDLSELPILIASSYSKEIEKQLRSNNIVNYSIATEIFASEDVVSDNEISHGNWPSYIKSLCDYPGKMVLEIGSRVVTGSCFREMFENAEYTGFDIYEGPNVDVVGDAHQLSSYFDKKFDLIFSSAVFEHLAMPWKVALEVIKILKPGGYVFIETHYSYSSHERPWHFFQFSENALHALFPEVFGMQCIKKGCCNLLEGYFSEEAVPYLAGKSVPGLYCHSEILLKKEYSVDETNLSWDEVVLEDVVGSTRYPYDKMR